MPQYLSTEEFRMFYGDNAVDVLAIEGSDTVSDERLLFCINAAENEVDSYLGNAFELPLPGCDDPDDSDENDVPPMLKRFVADMAIYILGQEHPGHTEIRSRRYREAVRWCKSVAKGDTKLGIEVETEVPTKAGLTVRTGPDRVATFCYTKGIV